MHKQSITAPEAPTPGGSYSSAILWRDLLFISGQTPRDSERRLVDGPFAQQAQQAFANLNALARAGGTSAADALRITVYLRDLDDTEAMDAAFAAAFSEPRPARTTIHSNLAVSIEVDGIYAVPASATR